MSMPKRVAAIDVSHWHSAHDACYLSVLRGLGCDIVGVSDRSERIVTERANRFGGSCFPRLVFGFGFHCGILRANAGRHDQELAATSLSNRPGFLHRSNDTVNANLFCELRELHDAKFWRAPNSDFLHGLLVHARQDGYSKKSGPVGAHGDSGADGLHGGFEHGSAAERVDVDKLHSRHGRRRKYGTGNGVGNVVEFQVEKNARAERSDFFNGGGARSGEELVADLEHTDKIGNLLCEFQCRG